MNCPQCNTPVFDNAKFCPVCGISFEERKCKKCQKTIPAGARFCAHCGTDQTLTKSCENCHAPLEGGSKFCTVCGAPTEPVKSPMEDKYAAQTLTFGILGLAFSLVSWISILGIIFSAIARGKLKKYLKYSGEIKDARAGVGNGLSIAGLASGIAFTAIWVIVILLSGIFYSNFFSLFGEWFGTL